MFFSFHLEYTSESRYIYDCQSPFFDQGNGSRETRLHNLQSSWSNALSTRTTLVKTVPYFISLNCRWILCPSNNAEEITSRHDTITFMHQPQLKEMVVSLQREIQHVADLPLVVRRITSQRGSNSDWIRLMDSVSSVLECGRLLDVMRKYTDASKWVLYLEVI